VAGGMDEALNNKRISGMDYSTQHGWSTNFAPSVSPAATRKGLEGNAASADSPPPEPINGCATRARLRDTTGRAVDASISMSSMVPALPLLLPTNTCWCRRVPRPPLGTCAGCYKNALREKGDGVRIGKRWVHLWSNGL
jgi:hypothetical protein